MQVEKKKTARRIIVTCLFVAVLLLVVAWMIHLLNGKETRLSSSDESLRLKSLSCSASEVEDAFFASNNEVDAKHDVKFTFSGNTVGKASYIYVANFETEKEATTAANDFHVKYNVYMGSTGTYQEDLTPTFTQAGKKVIINLFIDSDKFNADTAKFLFLNADEFSDDGKYAIDELMKIYTGKGFSCTNRE